MAAVSPEPLSTLTSHQSEAQALAENMQTVTSRTAKIDRLGIKCSQSTTVVLGKLLEALNRHRGKGQQKVTVEHVHVHNGGQAIVGNVEGDGLRTKSENQPHALGYAAGQTLRSENKEREVVPVAGDGKR